MQRERAKQRNWEFNAYRFSSGFEFGVEARADDLHDECGRWLHIGINLFLGAIEIERYLGPTREPYTEDDKMVFVRPDELCASCASTLKGRAADSKSDG